MKNEYTTEQEFIATLNYQDEGVAVFDDYIFWSIPVLLSKYRAYLIEKGLIVSCETYEALAERWYNADKKANKVSDLESENTRLREALEKIARSTDGKNPYHAVFYFTAQQALNPNSKEESDEH